MGPILLKPNYISPVWSGSRVNEARGIEDATMYGEAFDVSVHEGLVNIVDGGEFDGMPLDCVIEENRDAIMGDLDHDGIVQIITMDAGDNLSIQVHPNEAYAQEHEGDHEKAESWYVLAADPGASIICGTTTDDLDALREATKDDSVGDRFGRRVPVSEGDFVLIPAGTLHAMGAGVFALEVGSFGFKTYRFCDWGRGRELHVDQAFDVLDTSLRPDPAHLGPFDSKAPASIRRGVTHPLFTSDVVDVRGSWEMTTGGAYVILSCVGGAARIVTDAGEAELGYTRSALIPACVGKFHIEGTCRILVSRAVSACEDGGAR